MCSKVFWSRDSISEENADVMIVVEVEIFNTIPSYEIMALVENL